MVLADHLRDRCAQEGWMLTVIDDVQTPAAVRREHICHADIVISLAPPALQQIIAEECIEFKKTFAKRPALFKNTFLVSVSALDH